MSFERGHVFLFSITVKADERFLEQVFILGWQKLRYLKVYWDSVSVCGHEIGRTFSKYDISASNQDRI